MKNEGMTETDDGERNGEGQIGGSNDDADETALVDQQGGTRKELPAPADVVPPADPQAAEEDGNDTEGGAPATGHEGGGDRNRATLIVELVQKGEAELWHDADGVAYITAGKDQHHATWKLRSAATKTWLAALYYNAYKTAPGSTAINDAITVLTGLAVHEGREYPVFVRVAGLNGKTYLDLGDQTWRCVEVDAGGWRVLERAPAEIRFRRAKAMLSLPVPEQSSDADWLRDLVNVTDEDWPLVLAWLVAAFRPDGPYPILCVFGEQGSAKSSLCRTLRELIDPNSALTRAEPPRARDLAIASGNSWCVALDNVSHLPPWLSDALCRMSTGGGFATRMLHTDDDEAIFSAKRPILINGICEVTERPDLLDRALIINLPRIPEDRRHTEAELRVEIKRFRPYILGALLAAVSVGLRRLPNVKLEKRPRMADFAIWAVACEQALGLEEGAFLRSYQRSRDSATATALEASPLTAPLRAFLKDKGGKWTGTPTALWKALKAKAGEQTARRQEWPKGPQPLSRDLKRLAPDLRQVGIEMDLGGHTGKNRQVTIRKSTGKSVSRVTRVSARAEKTPRPNGTNATNAISRKSSKRAAPAARRTVPPA
jgi:hypothetical protein